MKTLFYLLVCMFCISCNTEDPTEPGALVPLTVDEDPSLPSIFVNNTLLHSEAFGNPNNPMIVMLHGGPGGDYRSMLNFKELANDGYYVVFYDQRGSGLSRRHNDRDIYTTQLVLDDLEEVINYYQIPNQKLFLAGHSWGGALATAFVNKFPDRVDGLILMEPGGLTWGDTEDYTEEARSLEIFSEATNDMVFLDQLLTSSDHNVLDYKVALSVAADIADGNTTGSTGPYPFWRFGAVSFLGMYDYADEHSFDLTTDLDQFQTNVLFAYSELNQAYGRKWAEKESGYFTNVELIEIQGTGHEIPYFGWDNLYPSVLSYLNSI